MTSLALINELIGLPANASEHGYQIDHIIEFCHWFMGALFLGWSAFFLFVLWRFHKSRNPVANHDGVTSGISTHLEFAVVLIEAVPPGRFRHSALGEAGQCVPGEQRRDPGPRDWAAI